MRRVAVLLFTFGLALCISGNAWAGIVYSNLGSGSTVYNKDRGWGVVSGLGTNPGYLASAFSFTAPGDTTFSELRIALELMQGANAVTVSLMSNSGGLPGSALESWNVTGLPMMGTCCTLQTLAGSGTTALTAGTLYWVAVFPAASDMIAVWSFNSTGATGTFFGNSGTGWSGNIVDAVGAFEIQGVPEPGTAALTLAAGMLALLSRLRRR